MISKRTKEILRILEEILPSQNLSNLIPEKKINSGRVDLYAEMGNYTYGFEIKQDSGDFHTNCGQNFNFDYNFFVVPLELCAYAMAYSNRLNEENLYNNDSNHVGVIAVDIENEKLIVALDAVIYQKVKTFMHPVKSNLPDIMSKDRGYINVKTRLRYQVEEEIER